MTSEVHASFGPHFAAKAFANRQAAQEEIKFQAEQDEVHAVGYVISGSAKLDLEGQTLNLKAGDSWLMPAGASHHYTITEPFTAIEATSPPAEVHGRDTA